MADRPRFPGGTFGNRFGDPAIDGEVLPPPIDPERFRHIQLLNEAVLVNFAASPNPRTPWGWSTLAWDVTMPTTFLPGVHVEAVLFGEGEQIVPAQGTRPARPYNETTYTLSLRTPLAVRMGLRRNRLSAASKAVSVLPTKSVALVATSTSGSTPRPS